MPDSSLRRRILSLSLAALGLPGLAVASQPRSIELGLLGGLRTKSDNNELGNAVTPQDTPQSGALVGLRAGYAVTDRIGLELEATNQFSRIDSTASGAMILGGRAWGTFAFLPTGLLQPFARIGVGGEMILTDSAKIPVNGEVDFGALAGVGVRVALMSRWVLRADVVSHLVPGRDGKTEAEWEGTVSAGLLLGGKDPDADLDGIADAADRCVNQPEDRDGFEDSDGCPDPDNDGDGVADAADRCPREAETKNGFQDTDGCPDQAPEVAKAPPKPVDTDGDGLVDPADKCPNERETVNRYLDADGCADTIPAALQPYLDTPLAVEFSGGGSKFGGKSSKALEALLKALQGQPTVAIEVVGHTDETATPEANKQLSLQRAEAVKTWLVGKGIAADRVRTSGRGAEQPRPGTVRGDTKNRRIEILFP